MQVERPAPLFVLIIKNMWCIYIIQRDTTKQIYIGFTSDIKRRIAKHNNNQNYSTRHNSGIWKLVYCEIYRTKEDAEKRERRLKHHGRAKQELLKRISKSLF
jgi:putative endonuclease